MFHFKYKFTFVLVVFHCCLMFCQDNNEGISNANSTIFNEFNSFFDKEIKRQGVKGDWLFELNEITGLHKFDFNKDGFNDVLIEFKAMPIIGGGVVNYYAVLFENKQGNEFKYVNYLDTRDLLFKSFVNSKFDFENMKKQQLIFYELVNSRFIKMKFD